MRHDKITVAMMILMLMLSTLAGCTGNDEGDDDDDTSPGTTQNDADGDGIPDLLDLCADTLADADVDSTGCEVVADTDADDDGVEDADDSCPNTPAGANVDTDGCEIAAPTDSDGDGVYDDDDQCANTPSGDNVDVTGCTIAPTVDVKIGLLSPQTGAMSAIAQDVENSVSLAISQMNDEQSAYHFILSIADSACDGQTAATAAQEMVNSGVVGIIGAACDDATLGAMDVAKTNSIPLISYASTSNLLSIANDDGFLWRVVASTSFQGIAAGTWAQLAQVESVAVLANDGAVDQSIAAAFEATMISAGATVCYSSTYAVGTTDFAVDISAISSANCGGLMMISGFADGKAIIEELDVQGLLGEEGITVVGHEGIGNEAFIDEFSDPAILDGIYGSRVSVMSQTFEGLTYENDYSNAYGSAPGQYGPEAFDATNVLLESIIEAGSTIGTDINSQILTTGTEYDGASGQFSFLANGDIPGEEYEFWKFTNEDTGVRFEIVATWSPYNGIWSTCRSTSPNVQIGLLAPQTGAHSTGAEGYARGLELALMLVNVQQRDVCFIAISEDTESTTAGAGVAAQALVDNGVVGIVGASRCDETIAAKDVAVDNKITMISYACTSPELTTLDDGSDTYGSGYVWRTIHSDAWPADAAAAYATEKGLTDLAIYRVDDDAGQVLADSMTSAMNGSICADITFTPGSLGSSAGAATCDSIAVFADLSDSIAIVDDLRSNGFTGTIIGSEHMGTDTFKNAITSSTENIVVLDLAAAASESSLSKAFNIAFMMNYGISPTPFSQESADAGLLIALAYMYGYGAGLNPLVNSEYINWFIAAIADNYGGASGLLTVDSSTGDMSSKGMFEVFEYQTDGSLNLNYLWNPKDGMTTSTS
ncbi:MAG: ABC transporter substrate-binding protein [Euryarchaeota archaeon]|nr:ABC transporter substrate-binding protein [Euryarchaeota archaeon]